MRLFTKIFLCGTIVFSLAFLVSGYVLIQYSLHAGMEREKEFALKQFQYDKFTVQSGLLSNSEKVRGSLKEKEKMQKIFAGLTENISVPSAFFSEIGDILYSEIKEKDDKLWDMVKSNCNKLKEKNQTVSNVYMFQKDSTGSCIYTFAELPYKGNLLTEYTDVSEIEQIYFITRTDISDVLIHQEILINYFKRCYCIVISLATILLFIISILFTRPLKKMAEAADGIAGGNYRGRLNISGADEIGKLADSFNRMADAVEDKVEELSLAARQREDFVANFAHELKTPLTSVIGYADMLYQKELPRKEVKAASYYIWNEGMRLEALSLKLMDLIVLDRQQFTLQEMRADELLEDVSSGLYPLVSEKKIQFSTMSDPAYIKVDYDLIKTLLLNLADNSIKAGCTQIKLCGRCDSGVYKISIKDNGRGIPEDELSRITEAFYMVDKSRSRKQHGAGIGLALAEKIAKIHGCRLEFQSKENKGTVVSFGLPYEKEVSEYEE